MTTQSTVCTDTTTLEQSVITMSTTAEKACAGIMKIIRGTWATGPDYDTRLVVDTLRTIYELSADAQMTINQAATALGCQQDGDEVFKPGNDVDEEAGALQHAANQIDLHFTDWATRIMSTATIMTLALEAADINLVRPKIYSQLHVIYHLASDVQILIWDTVAFLESADSSAATEGAV